MVDKQNIENPNIQIREELISNEDDLPNGMKEISVYHISKYDNLCEDHLKIEKIIPLYYNKVKAFFFVFLNIISCFVINLFIVWFPKLHLCLLYSHMSLSKAKFLAIFGRDKDFEIVELKKIKLPNISNSFLKEEYITNIPQTNEIYLFSYKKFNYIYLPSSNSFVSINTELETSYENIHKFCSKGLNAKEIQYQRIIYDLCDLNIEIKSFWEFLFDEFSDPFYIFQVFSVILWVLDDYYAYSTLIIVTTIFSLFSEAYDAMYNMKTLRDMAKYSCKVNVYRKNNEGVKKLQQINSIDLVPGDLFEIQEEGNILPCDSLLLNGTVIVNESMLTGESTPIMKTSIPFNQDIFDISFDKKKFLFAGTKIMQKQSYNNQKVLALAYYTGFNTTKGSLIRSILYPKKNNYKFKRDSIKYIIMMGILCIIGIILALPFLIKANLSLNEIIARFLDLITTTVPPSLPTCLGIAISYSLSRLKTHDIFCIDKDRLNVAGKVNIIVFDKTGTLTEDTLDIFGFLPVTIVKGKYQYSNLITQGSFFTNLAFDYYKSKKSLKEHKIEKNKEIIVYFAECIGSCHSVAMINGKIAGDPIDVKMFESSEWELVEVNNDKDSLISTYIRPKREKNLIDKINQLSKEEEEVDESIILSNHYEIGIIRRFEFSSENQTMSVIVKNHNDMYYKLFCKGAPEKIKELCQPKTIPKHFNQVLNKYTFQGYHVIGLAMKIIKMDFIQSQQIERVAAESNLIFLGLVIVHNRLKKETIKSIETLQNAKIRMVMSTGDNLLTAVSVCKKCKLIQSETVVQKFEIENNQLIQTTIENFDEYDDNDFDLRSKSHKSFNEQNSESDEANLKYNTNFIPEFYESLSDSFEDKQSNLFPRRKYSNVSEDNPFEVSFEIQANFQGDNSEKLVFAITGQTFESLVYLNNQYVKTKDENLKIYQEVYKKILHHCYIFARMTPDNKKMLVECLKEEKLTVLMCGDGENDCSALRAADVGVSLSSEEASIASHFISSNMNISCLIKIIREGRASLVTSIQTFKYWMMYSLIQFFSVTFLMTVHSYLSDYQFLSTDIFITFPIAYFLAKTGPYHKLTPYKPNDSLLSFPIVTSILLQTFISFIFQYYSWVFLAKLMPWYINTCKDDESTTCQDNTLVFLISNMQYLIIPFVFSNSKPFRKPIYTNIQLSLFMCISLFYSIYIIISPDSYSSNILQLYDFNQHDKYFRYYLLCICILNFAVSFLAEKVLLPKLVSRWREKRYNQICKKVAQPGYTVSLNQIEKMQDYREGNI